MPIPNKKFYDRSMCLLIDTNGQNDNSLNPMLGQKNSFYLPFPSIVNSFILVSLAIAHVDSSLIVHMGKY